MRQGVPGLWATGPR